MPVLREDYIDWKQLLSDVITALDVEYSLAQRACVGTTYSLKDGVEISSEAGRYIYRFRMDLDRAVSFIDAPVKIRDGSNRQIEGEILSIDGDVIVLSLKERPSTSDVEMIIDLSFLLIELKKKLIAYRDHYTPRLSVLPLKAFGYRRDIRRDITLDGALSDRSLNEEQREAILNASKYEVSVVCGPPGTGKSRVLASIAAEAIRKGLRVLIATHTHSALDRALKLVVEELGRTGTKVEYGSIIRLGRALDPEVTMFEEDIILVNLSEELRAEFMKTHDDLRRCEDTLNKWYRRCGSIVSASKTIREHVSLIEEKVRIHERRLHAIRYIIKTTQQRINNLIREYQNILNSKPSILTRLFMMGRWKRMKMERLRNLEIEMRNQYERLRVLRELEARKINELSNARNDLESARSELKMIFDRGLKLEDLEKLSTYDSTIQHHYTHDEAVRVILANIEWLVDFIKLGGMEGISEKIQTLKKRLNEIEKNIQRKRIETRRRARLIASTLTKCMTELFDYVHVGALQRFDIALIDEVSMANLGLLWIATSIADRAVFFGDPNQLPPITLLDKKRHEELYELQSSNLFDWLSISYDNMDNTGDIPITFLKKQYRMGRRICNIVGRLFYGGMLESLTTHDGAVIFYDMDATKPMDIRTPSNSRLNGLNALLVGKIIEELLRNGVEERDIAVVTPYRAQAKLIKEVLRNRGFEEIRVGTVHTFQGGEKKVVVLDLVVRNRRVILKSPILSGKIGNKLLSTSMSRAIEKLIIVGSRSTLKGSNLRSFRELLHLLSRQEIKTPTLSSIQLTPLEKIQISSREEVYFSTNTVYEVLRKDISEAKKHVVIVSPFVEYNVLLDLLGGAKVPVTVYVRRGMERRIDFSKLPRNVHIEIVKKLHAKNVIIDDCILYTGSLNFLSLTGSEESVCRFEGHYEILRKIKNKYPPRI